VPCDPDHRQPDLGILRQSGIVWGVPWAALLIEPGGVIALAISDAYY
jgi:hypothetical protein